MYFSLHKTPKSVYYHVAYRDGTGKRTLRSTREISIVKAKIKAQAMVQLAEAERRGETDRRFFAWEIARYWNPQYFSPPRDSEQAMREDS